MIAVFNNLSNAEGDMLFNELYIDKKEKIR